VAFSFKVFRPPSLEFLISTMRATRFAHSILYLMTLIISDEKQSSRSFSVWSLLHSSVTSFFWIQIISSALCAQAHPIHNPLIWQNSLTNWNVWIKIYLICWIPSPYHNESCNLKILYYFCNRRKLSRTKSVREGTKSFNVCKNIVYWLQITSCLVTQNAICWIELDQNIN
jgi:hypothetical protein